ncbi:MAG: TetR/AcrR family transcriptional regulator [Muribaculaceae bacterium]|nr:TetR/AcrR family transcriptional regulator [Muribaculaceae bacterium]
MSEDDFNDKLFEAVYEILIKKGVKSTTMDSIARQLQISKRTLYEMFENKTELLTRAMKHHADNHRRKCEEIALNSPNLMESLVKIFKLHRDDISRVSVDFFRDMDRLHPGFRDDYETRHELFRKQMMKMFQYGVEQGVFRNDINFPTFVRIVELQMESVIRMKEIYTGDMSITEVFDTVMICYLRAIASPKGLEILDEAIPKYFPELSSSPHPAPEDENLDNEK